LYSLDTRNIAERDGCHATPVDVLCPEHSREAAVFMNHLGIYLMWLSVVISGIGGLGTAILYVVKPTESKLALMRPFSLAAIFSALASAAAGSATVLRGLAASGPSPSMPDVLMGWSEVLVPIYVAFSFLGVAWLVLAIGLKRSESRMV
jgi:hypothetical protein